MYDVFVYGTLKRGFQNHDAGLSDARYIGRYRSVEQFPLIVGGRWFSPCLLDEPGAGHRVLGEVFRVTADCLGRLDEIESLHLPNGYKRREIDVAAETGPKILQTWVYLKDRHTVEGIHGEPMAEYARDPRYIEKSDPRRRPRSR